MLGIIHAGVYLWFAPAVSVGLATYNLQMQSILIPQLSAIIRKFVYRGQ